MSQCFLFTFNLLLISSVVCLVSIILTSHLPYGFRIRFYVFLAEHIYIFAIVLSYELHNAIDRMYLILFLTFGCFLQFGGIEFYLATLPNTEISFDDQSISFRHQNKGKEIYAYVYLYYFFNFLCGIANLVQILICGWICFYEEDQTQRVEEVMKQLENKIVQVNGNQGECSICLMKYRTGEKCYDLLCGHIFHQECLADWLKVQLNCPLCRDRIDTSE